MKKGVVIDLTCQKCFVKFCAGDSSLCDALWLSRPVELDSDHTETLTENNQHYTMREIAGILKISKSSVENHLHQFGYVYFSDVCVPHKLSGEKNTNFLDYTSICNFLLKHNERFLLLKHIVTGNEKDTTQSCGTKEIMQQAKWTTSNYTKGRSSSKEGDVVYMMGLDGSPLLWAPFQKTKQLILCSQLDQLKAAFDKTHPELVNGKFIIFHQDDPRLHVSLMTRQKLL